jgi:hypothetical protein
VLYPSLLPWTPAGKEFFNSSSWNSASSWPAHSYGTSTGGLKGERWDRSLRQAIEEAVGVNQHTTRLYGFISLTQCSERTHSHNTFTPTFWFLTTLDIVSSIVSCPENNKLLWTLPLPNSNSLTPFLRSREKISIPVSPLKRVSPLKKYSSPRNMPRRHTGGTEVYRYFFFNLGARWG